MNEGSSYSIDFQAVTDMASGLKDSLAEGLAGLLPILAGIGCAGLALFVGYMVFKLIKRWSKSST